MKEIAFGRPILGEEEKQAVMNVLNGTLLVHGPQAIAFEEAFARFTGAPFAVSVSSCTAAMHLAYFYLGLGPADEVIVPAQTHTATAHAVELCGARPVFLDAEAQTGNIDISRLEACITEGTRAIAVVHYLGMPVDMEAVVGLAQKYGLFVVEDCALAIGSRLKGIHAGLYGDVGCFSFYPVKHMTTAEGGMLITRHEEIARKIQRQKAFGVDRTSSERKIPGVYDVTMLGFNYRLNEIQAAIGIEQLKRVPGFLHQRQINYSHLQQRFSRLENVTLLQSSHGDFQSSYYCLSVLLKEGLAPYRYEIVEQLKQHGIGTSIYYPKPVPHMTYYKNKYGYSEEKSFPVAAWLSNSSIALPVGPHLGTEDMEYIVDTFERIVEGIKL